MERDSKKNKAYGKVSIRTIFPLLFTATVTVCIVSLIVVFSQWVSNEIQDNLRVDAARQAAELSASMEREIADMTDLANQVYYQLIKSEDYQGKERNADLQMFYRQYSDVLTGLALYSDDGTLLWCASEESDEIKQHVKDQAWFQDATGSIERISFGNPRIQITTKGLERTIPVSRYVELTDSGETSGGVLRLDFSMQAFRSILNSFSSTPISYCYVLSDNSTLLYHPFSKEIESGILEEWSIDELAQSDKSFVTAANGKKWLVETQQIGYTGWKLVVVNSLTDIQHQNHNLYIVVWLLLCTTGLVLMIMDIVLLRQIIHPVAELSDAMEHFGNGQLDTRAAENGIGELKMLSYHFNNMAGKIQELLNKILNDEKEKRHMERKLLQSQITPHFLYNTLDSIIWMIQGGEYEGAEEMVSLLAKLFRVSLSQGKDIIPLRKELEHAVSYLSIQHIRFKDKFEFRVNVDESLLDYLCPKVTIQPILENAVYHGMEGKYDDGEIILSIYEKNDTICIDVTDNGEGMTEEQIEHILHHKVVTSKRGSGIGVHNVDDRLKLLFGKQYGVTIISVLDEGTTVRMTIPKVRDSDEI